jgi:hypothetical protein
MTRRPPLLPLLAALPAVLLLLGRLRLLHPRSDIHGLVSAGRPVQRLKHMRRDRADAAIRLTAAVVNRLPRLFPQACLYWSLTAYHFLSRAGETPVIHLGIKLGAGEMLSHAWVTVGDVKVAGQPQPQGFTEMTSLS